MLQIIEPIHISLDNTYTVSAFICNIQHMCLISEAKATTALLAIQIKSPLKLAGDDSKFGDKYEPTGTPKETEVQNATIQR